jgi:phosphopantetheinyl transferase (holo-ACP synthase)
VSELAEAFGVDVVTLARLRHHVRFDGRAARLRFSDDEHARLEACEDEHERSLELARAWAVKESAVKALGGRPRGLEWRDVATRPAAGAPPSSVRALAAALAEACGGTPSYARVALPSLCLPAVEEAAAREFGGDGWGAWVHDETRLTAAVVLRCRGVARRAARVREEER